MSDGTSLDLPTLIRLRAAAHGLPLAARRRTLATQAGAYLSAYRGRGMEFDEVRAYQAGDDARDIDWRVTARRGRPHTKLFREERERPVLILADLNPGMFFGSRRQFKSVLAGHLAALLAWSADRAGDRIGGVVNGSDSHHEIHPSARGAGVLALLNTLVRLQPQSPGELRPGRFDEALARLKRVARPGSLVFLLSDFRETGNAAEGHLTALAEHNDLIAVHIHDPLEINSPPPGQYRLGSGSQRYPIDTSSQRVREGWHRHFVDHEAHLQSLCRRHRVQLISASTADAPLRILQGGLARRGRAA